jgi:replication-associated recombination protein RarA
MISGPPGIGKTSMVELVALTLGMETMFINASDKRSKTAIEGMLTDLCESSTIDNFKKKSNKTIIVMDEVDGVSGG